MSRPWQLPSLLVTIGHSGKVVERTIIIANLDKTRDEVRLTRGTFVDCTYLDRQPPLFETSMEIKSVTGTARIECDLWRTFYFQMSSFWRNCNHVEFGCLMAAWKSIFEMYSVEEYLLACKSEICGQRGSHTSSQVGTSLCSELSMWINYHMTSCGRGIKNFPGH